MRKRNLIKRFLGVVCAVVGVVVIIEVVPLVVWYFLLIALCILSVFFLVS